MTRTTASGASRTYVPDDGEGSTIAAFMKVLEQAGVTADDPRPALIGPDGSRVPLPDAMYDVLRQVAEALTSGMGVHVAPLNAMLTTQQAADFLGISRPTLVRMLDRGALPMERPGRHRYVRLRDLVAYQEAQATRRGAALDRAAVEGQGDGIYDATDGPAPRTR